MSLQDLVPALRCRRRRRRRSKSRWTPKASEHPSKPYSVPGAQGGLMRQPRSQCRLETSSARNFADWMPDGKITSLGQEVFLHASAQRGMGHPSPQEIGIRRFPPFGFPSSAASCCYAERLNMVRQLENSVSLFAVHVLLFRVGCSSFPS